MILQETRYICDKCLKDNYRNKESEIKVVTKCEMCKDRTIVNQIDVALLKKNIYTIDSDLASEIAKRLEEAATKLKTRKEKVSDILENNFTQFLPVSQYNNKVILKENEIGMIYNCSVIFNPEYEEGK